MALAPKIDEKRVDVVDPTEAGRMKSIDSGVADGHKMRVSRLQISELHSMSGPFRIQTAAVAGGQQTYSQDNISTQVRESTRKAKIFLKLKMCPHVVLDITLEELTSCITHHQILISWTI